MDIPNTGAIFTLGKSHLAENTQSYFFIKNDPVRRLTSGARQSAVICESGRLFVWGENYHGELGVGTNSSSDIITKPTCVKSLKTLGLKIADVAFGQNWAVILTHSNEVFFTGRNIFPVGTKVVDNFTSTKIGTKTCSIIRKPFRLEDFDNCLSTSEDQENFTSISAGNAHFAVMTSFGRLVGWGSNDLHQLGSDNPKFMEPYEIVLESKVKQFVCGPTSTLILSEDGKLYLTGRLSEFACTQFTELQKNLSPQEEILFIHISQASEIYIVTNEGGIYRSMESMRHSSLIFQRFYDYDSEENGQIVKLLRGTSFYAALTKANKFYTTFSESGHHLKTFREISKFKNLRTLDMAVGDKHILVHGIPRSAKKHLNKTFVVHPDSNANVSELPEHGQILEGKISEEADVANQNGNNDETVKPNTPEHPIVEDNRVENADAQEVPGNKEEENHGMANGEQHTNGNPPASASSSKDMDALEDSSPTASLKSAKYHKLDESEIESNTSTASKRTVLTANADNSSPTHSIKSRRGSARSIRFDENALKDHNPSEAIVRPKTPYPDEEEDSLDKTSPGFDDSLEYIPEPVATFESENQQQRSDSSKSRASMKKRKLTPIHRNADPMIPSEEDEQLTVEISTTDFLDKTIVNEIRFINNGIDVTEKIASDLPVNVESVSNGLEEEATKELKNANESLHVMADDVKNSATEEADKMVDKVAEKVEGASTEAETTFGKVKSNVNAAVAKVSSEVDSAVGIVSTKFDSAVSSISEGVDSTVTSVSNTVNTTVTKISTKVDDAKQNISNLFAKDDTPNRSSNASIAMTTEEISTPKDDDERTTASVDSTGTGNPFDNDSEQKFSTMKHSLENDIRPASESGKGKMKQFLSDMKAKGKGISCRDDKAIRVEDDPPKYTPVDQYADQSDKTSKVCTIL